MKMPREFAHLSEDEILATDAMPVQPETAEKFDELVNKVHTPEMYRVVIMEELDLDDVIEGFAESGNDEIIIRRETHYDPNKSEGGNFEQSISVTITNRQDASWDDVSWGLEFFPSEGLAFRFMMGTIDWMPIVDPDIDHPLSNLLEIVRDYIWRTAVEEEGKSEEIPYTDKISRIFDLALPYIKDKSSRTEERTTAITKDSTSATITESISTQPSASNALETITRVNIKTGNGSYSYSLVRTETEDSNVDTIMAVGPIQELEDYSWLKGKPVTGEILREIFDGFADQIEEDRRHGAFTPTEGKLKKIISLLEQVAV